MASFEVKIVSIDNIEPHPNADRLELAVIAGYKCVVGKGSYQVGQKVVYIPEQAMLDIDLADQWKCRDYLHGNAKNRVKAIKLRGELSQGMTLPLDVAFPDGNIPPEDTDIKDLLKIQKWEEKIPESLAGKVYAPKPKGEFVDICLKYDIENFQAWPNAFQPGTEVVITEKLHGTWACIARYPGLDIPDLPDDVFITSKGLSARGFVIKYDSEGNVYINHLSKYKDVVKSLSDRFRAPVYVLGEIYGRGIQDLSYGLLEPSVRIFDIYLGKPGEGYYVDHALLRSICSEFKLELVPVLYQGAWNKDEALKLRDGNSTLFNGHIREGIVIKRTGSRRHTANSKEKDCLKWINPEYLLRKNGTEFN